MLQVKLEITLKLTGPVLSKDSTMGDWGVDARMAQNNQKQYYIPNTLIVGKLRQAWREFADIDSKFIEDTEIADLLGQETGNRENDTASIDPIRKRLCVTDFIDCPPDGQVRSKKQLTRISINKELGSVDKGALLLMETPYAPGEPVDFKGVVSFIAQDDTEKKKIINWLEAGLRWTTSFGGERTIGFGRNAGVEVVDKFVESAFSAGCPKLNANGIIDIVITPNAPFCLAKRKTNDNLFESESFIAGNIIKGSLVHTWMEVIGERKTLTIDEKTDKKRLELCRNFEKIRFTHAFPVKKSENKRPVAVPLSLIQDEEKEFYDAAFYEKPEALYSLSPRFCLDWKDRGKIDKDYGWEDPPRELRVRTAIDAKSGNAENEKLFSYEMIVPDDFKWYGRLDLSRIPDEAGERQKVFAQLYDLLQFGLYGLSKNKIRADIELLPEGVKPAVTLPCEPISRLGKHLVDQSQDEYYWLVTLQTPALIADLSNIPGTGGAKALKCEYEKFWSDQFNNTLELVNYFAQQRLAGGYYLYNRFQKGNDYMPYPLTTEGSVFVLKAKSKDLKEAQKLITDWAEHGLPLPGWVAYRYKRNDKPGYHWSNCPYIPENGYGEIAVNSSKSLDLADKLMKKLGKGKYNVGK